MGWNDHSSDSDDVSNLPPEAFSSFSADGPFEPDDRWMHTADKCHQIIAIRAWFLARYSTSLYSGE
jgi:hypothetical protein